MKSVILRVSKIEFFAKISKSVHKLHNNSFWQDFIQLFQNSSNLLLSKCLLSPDKFKFPPAYRRTNTLQTHTWSFSDRENRVPCNENRFFPVRKTSQGKPCFHYRDGFVVHTRNFLVLHFFETQSQESRPVKI